MPGKGRDRLRANAEPVVRRLVGEGRRRQVLDDVAARLPHPLRPTVDMSGWTSTELLAYLDAGGKALPPRRAGADTARQVNALAGVLPVEAVLLARATIDLAPAATEPVHPTLRRVLERYLPDSIRAYVASRGRDQSTDAGHLLVTQLRLLHRVAVNVERASADHNELDLRIQDAFLKERFADLTPGALGLDDEPLPLRVPGIAVDEPEDALLHRAPGPSSGNAHAQVDTDPVVLFAPPPNRDRKLLLRLALPKGHPTTLGAVLQDESGAVHFRRTEARRWLVARRATGFPGAQVDLTLSLDVTGIRRLLVFAASPARTAPTSCVLFVRDATRAQTALSTLLANRPAAAVTVIGSGYATADGLVVRNESTLYPNLRAACLGFGYDAVTWLDADTPIM